jgi:DNA-binding NarL/FixJ family response regulator
MSRLTERITAFVQLLSGIYNRSKLPCISRRHFKHSEMMDVLERLRSNYLSLFKPEEVGASVEGRSINLIKLGGGQTKVFMWSQMYGGESTATRALRREAPKAKVLALTMHGDKSTSSGSSVLGRRAMF